MPLLDGQMHDEWFAICARLDDRQENIRGKLHLRLRMSDVDPSSEAYAAAMQCGGDAFCTDALTLMQRIGFAPPRGLVVQPAEEEADGLGRLGGTRRGFSVSTEPRTKRASVGVPLGAGLMGAPSISRRSSLGRVEQPSAAADAPPQSPYVHLGGHAGGPVAQVTLEQVANAEVRRRMLEARKGSLPAIMGSDVGTSKQLRPVPKERLVARVRVHVLEASNLAPRDSSGTSDPYVVVHSGESKFRTSTHKQVLNAVWGDEGVGENVEFELDALDDSSYVHAVVFDWNRANFHAFLGEVIQPLFTLEPNVLHDVTYDLQHGGAKPGDVSGTLRMAVEVVLPRRSGRDWSMPSTPHSGQR